jgi:hypothetical protein
MAITEPQVAKNNRFITSRAFRLPTDLDDMVDGAWYHMWQRQQWPYRKLERRDTLYWFDPTEEAIVWKSRVAQVGKFKYANKTEARRRLKDFFGKRDIHSQYFDNAKPQGYCLAYIVDSLERVHLPKPSDCKLPQIGWLRDSDKCALDWLRNQIGETPSDSPSADGRCQNSIRHEAEESDLENILTEYKQIKRSRSARLRKAAFKKAAGKCCVCDRDYSKVLGGRGVRVLQVHHRNPLSDNGEAILTTLADLAVVCANCHLLLHLDPSKPLTTDELKLMLNTETAK